jgi:hypothetical protein
MHPGEDLFNELSSRRMKEAFNSEKKPDKIVYFNGEYQHGYKR